MKTVGITCVRNEGPWLLDWIAHHHAAGFDHFLIASHDCTDGTDTLLDALAQTGLVTHLPFELKGDACVQWQALKLLSRHKRYKNADLALFFDVDEYLVLDNITLDTLIQDADAVPLRWHLFGNSGHEAWHDAPVTERFTMAAPDAIDLPLAHFFKTLHRPSAFRELGVHRPKHRKDAQNRWRAASGQALSPAFSAQQSRINLYGTNAPGARAWLNHYSVRSIEEFVLKSARGLPNHMEKPIATGYWAERNFNTTEDTRIAPMLAGSQQARTALNGLNDLHALHDASVAAHQSALNTLKMQRATVDFMWQLSLLASSTPPSKLQLSAHLARLQTLNAQEKKN